ncbi:MAG: hypothetical protein KKC46_19500 [Proteobacteria bacterium]|nr:hypothetical protein [Pseudomonadota bacterium]
MTFDYSLAIGVFGVLLAIYQGFERKRLKGFVRTQAWYLYSVAILSFTTIQTTLKAYKEAHKDNFNTQIFEHLSKSEAYNESLFLECIRQIQLSEPHFNIQSIMTWKMQGKISESHIQLFERMMIMDSPSLFYLWYQQLRIKIQDKIIKPPEPHQNTKDDTKPPTEIS